MTGGSAVPGRDPAAELLTVLRASGLTLATAESLTGGLVAAAITAVPGASHAYRGGLVAYATAVKASVLGVPADLLAESGPVSAATAGAMAAAARSLFGADLAIATTGVAGPDPVGDLFPGVMFVAAVLGPGEPRVRRVQAAGERGQLRSACVAEALALGLMVLGPGNTARE